MIGVIFLLSIAAFFLFVNLLIPVFLGILSEHAFPLAELVVFTLLGLFISILVLASIHKRNIGMSRVQSMLAIILMWSLLPAIAAIPFVIAGNTSFLFALFEGYSGITTTGATTYQNPSYLPLPMRFWRSQLEWLGGFLTLFSVLHIFAPSGIGGLPQAGGSFVRGERYLTPHLDVDRVRRLFVQYVTVTLIAVIGFIMAGVDAFHALMLSMMAIATGGFVGLDGPLDLAIPPAAITVLWIMLALGATSLFWQNYTIRDLSRILNYNREAKLILLVVCLIGLAYSGLIYNGAGNSGIGTALTSLNEGFFTAASIISTSGIQTRPGVIALLPSLMVIFLVPAIASIFSTSGGVKLYRMAGMYAQARHELQLLVYPSSIYTPRFLGAQGKSESLRTIWTMFVMATLTISAGTLLMSAVQTGFEGGFTAAIALFSNAGPVYQALIPLNADPEFWPRYDQFGPLGIMVSIFLMLLGRLEVIVIFAALNISYWLSH